MASFSALPSIDRLLTDPRVQAVSDLPRLVLRDAARATLEEQRTRIRRGEEPAAIDLLVDMTLSLARRMRRSAYRPVINGTGVVLHTNLGRAPLPRSVANRVADLSTGYLNLEIDLESGERDHRHDRLRPALSRVLGCQDVVVVNNNAAATLLALMALAAGEAVGVSRGEQIEIGGSFRMPEILALSGARMIEVGTTNRTHLRDYEAALDQGAKLLLKVHRSNYELTGFVAETGVAELAALCRRRGAILVHDLGMGLLHPLPLLGQQSVRTSLLEGAHLVLFSGDKLLGGPQCGVIAGDGSCISQIRSHPMTRVMRPDKMILVALEETLLGWEADPTGNFLPTIEMLNRPAPVLEAAAKALREGILARLGERVSAEILPVQGATGGGSLPGLALPSWAVAIGLPGGGTTGLHDELRRGDPALLGKMEEGRLLLDVRTLLVGDADRVIQALATALEGR